MKLNKDQWLELIREYEAGQRVVTLAEKYNITPGYIYILFKKLTESGAVIKRRPQNGSVVKEVAELLNSGR